MTPNQLQVLSDEQLCEVLTTAYASPEWTMDDVRAARAIESATLAALAKQAQEPEVVTSDYKQEPGSKNCMQCAVAYMLGVPLADVPDFEQAGSEAWEAFYEFFAERGFAAEMLPPSMEIDGDYLASGDTARGTSHMVVMRGGRLLHDPHPSNAGLRSVQVVWLIARKAGVTTPPAPQVPAPVDERHRAVALELDRLMLVIESAVRWQDPTHHAAVLSLLKANRAALQSQAPQTKGGEA